MATKSKDKKHTSAAHKAAKKTTDYRSQCRFVEGTSLHRQIGLFAVGSLPYLKDRARSALLDLRSALHSIAAAIGKIRVPQGVQMTAFLAVSVALVVTLAFNILYTPATTVSFNGVELATVASEEEAAAARQSVEKAISNVVGYNYTLEDSAVSYSTGYTYRTDVENSEKLRDALNDQLDVVKHGYALYVNDVFVGATQTAGALEEILTQITSAYRTEHTVSIDFEEKVEIIECDLPADQFTNLAEVALILTSTKEGEITYTVEQGDCWSVIAQDHNMTNNELLALNPGYDIDKLQIGDVLLISNAVPYLTVLVTQMEYYIAEVPFDTEYVDDNTMWKGDTRIISKGSYGSADVSALVTYRGTTEMERTIVTEKVLTEPTVQVEARGTVERPSWAPTGTFRWPTNGRITSPYGYRYIFGSRSFHGGIDIANSTGTNIYASDGGVVVYAGWKGTYGYLIQIDHKNGYTTYYAHCSKLLVGVGDKVHKGQHIAEMGSTGRSTGPHLHFEVRYYGERKNPTKYLPAR